MINKSLRYVLYAYGQAVKPNNVSVGERNIIALCYFFAELIMNQEAKEGYSKKLILVIDDPVSSFDFENKVGIMSLLKAFSTFVYKTGIVDISCDDTILQQIGDKDYINYFIRACA